MKRKTLVGIHLAATMVAVLTISTFFFSSLFAEIHGGEMWIRVVKKGIIYALPLLLFAMPAMAITGNNLAGNSKQSLIIMKQRRMKWIMLNGMLLTSLAVFLYYRSNFQTIDAAFFFAQVAELAFGMVNLILIGMNIKAGLRLSGRLNAGKKNREKNGIKFSKW